VRGLRLGESRTGTALPTELRPRQALILRPAAVAGRPVDLSLDARERTVVRRPGDKQPSLGDVDGELAAVDSNPSPAHPLRHEWGGARATEATDALSGHVVTKMSLITSCGAVPRDSSRYRLSIGTPVELRGQWMRSIASRASGCPSLQRGLRRAAVSPSGALLQSDRPRATGSPMRRYVPLEPSDPRGYTDAQFRPRRCCTTDRPSAREVPKDLVPDVEVRLRVDEDVVMDRAQRRALLWALVRFQTISLRKFCSPKISSSTILR
jgi:hypothetical protein